jgi:hypothetical protein
MPQSLRIKQAKLLQDKPPLISLLFSSNHAHILIAQYQEFGFQVYYHIAGYRSQPLPPEENG